MCTNQPWDVPHLGSGSLEPEVDEDKITVYNMRFCPFAQRTMLVLLAKNIPFDVVNIDLTNKPDWFVEKTWGLVSVVRYKKDFIMESLINSDFIDELDRTNSLHPEDPAEKAKGRLLVELYGKMRTPYYSLILRSGKETEQDTKTERLRLFGEINKTLEEMEAELGRRKTPFFSGQEVGMTDLMVWPWMERLPCLDILYPGLNLVIPEQFQLLKAWMLVMAKEPPVLAYALEPEQHAKFYKSWVAGSPSYDMLLPSS